MLETKAYFLSCLLFLELLFQILLIKGAANVTNAAPFKCKYNYFSSLIYLP